MDGLKNETGYRDVLSDPNLWWCYDEASTVMHIGFPSPRSQGIDRILYLTIEDPSTKSDVDAPLNKAGQIKDWGNSTSKGIYFCSANNADVAFGDTWSDTLTYNSTRAIPGGQTNYTETQLKINDLFSGFNPTTDKLWILLADYLPGHKPTNGTRTDSRNWEMIDLTTPDVRNWMQY